MMHRYLFDAETRTNLGLPCPSSWGKLWSSIAVVGNFFMSLKEIQIGSGLQVRNGTHYSRMRWIDEHIPMMSEETKEWYLDIKDKITEDRRYFKASPGMLMGMLNAGSTTLGLITQNYKMDPLHMKVMTLRSSDDSMSTYLAETSQGLRECVNRTIKNMGLAGINISPDKSFFFREGFGEYTSWYIEDKFVSQFGVETSSLRPQGKNPNDDMYAIA